MEVSFSPQFSQRWANTSQLIRQAIATELSDIVRLLQPETELATFQFTHPNLLAYIDELEANLANSPVPSANSIAQAHTSDRQTQTTQQQPLNPKQTQPPNQPLSIEQQQALITRLEQQIDDYIADNMIKVSEEIKAWVRQEIEENGY